MIGDGPDYYDGINREEDKLVKLGDEVQEWWDNLKYQVQFELMDIEYPDHAHLLDLEGMWEGLDWETKLDIWRRENGMKRIHTKRISKKGNIIGKTILRKIEKCPDCNFVYKPIKSYACGITHTQIKDITTIPDWCPLEDNKDEL